jgi:hypothetical protein
MPQLKPLSISIFAAVVMLLFGGITEVNADPLTYKVEGGTVSIVSCDTNASGELVIPSIYEGKTVTRIGDFAFVNCSSLTSLTIPNSVTSIGWGAFGDCISLTSVTIPDSITTIGWRVFGGCISLTSVTIPESVTTIWEDAFQYCRSLTILTIPDSVTSIGDYAFSGCSGLTSIEVGKGNTKYTSEDGVLFDKNKTRLIQLPAGKSGHYTIPDSVTSIGDHAFLGCSSLMGVTIPDSVASIGSAAFYDCSSLTRITFDGDAPIIFSHDAFMRVSDDAKVFINPDATGFDKTFAGLPVVILKKIQINAVSKTDSPFTISFESKSGATYEIEVTHDLKQWGKIGKVKGTGSSVKFTDPRLPIVPFERNYFRVKLVE